MLCSTLWKNSGQLFAISISESIRFVFQIIPTHGRMIMISKKMYAPSIQNKIGSTTNNLCPNQKDVP